MLDELGARKALVNALRKDALRHAEKFFDTVGEDFDELDHEIPRTIDDKHFWTAFAFWDSWIDQCNHGFEQNFYDGISEQDWPVLAKEVAECVEQRQPISNALIVRHFEYRPGFL